MWPQRDEKKVVWKHTKLKTKKKNELHITCDVMLTKWKKKTVEKWLFELDFCDWIGIYRPVFFLLSEKYKKKMVKWVVENYIIIYLLCLCDAMWCELFDLNFGVCMLCNQHTLTFTNMVKTKRKNRLFHLGVRRQKKKKLNDMIARVFNLHEFCKPFLFRAGCLTMVEIIDRAVFFSFVYFFFLIAI